MTMEFHQVNDPADYQPDGRELEPNDWESESEMDRRMTGSFAEGWNRLAAMINAWTELAKPHIEGKP